jgi:hypothetical protein
MTSCCYDPTDERLFRALTGTSREEFRKLLEVFTTSYHILRETEYQANTATRYRKPGGGAKGKLPTCAAKLFFVLYYWKNGYPPKAGNPAIQSLQFWCADMAILPYAPRSM